MEKLKEAISNKIDELSEKDLNKDEEYIFFKELLGVFNANNSDTYSEVSKIAYLGGVLWTHNINMEFSEFMKELENMEDVINLCSLSDKTLKEYFGILKKAYDSGVLNEDDLDVNKLSNKIEDLGDKIKIKVLDKLIFTVELKDDYYDSKASNSMIKLFRALPDPDLFVSFSELTLITELFKSEFDKYVDEIKSVHDSKEINKMLRKKKEKIFKELIKDFIVHFDLKIFEYYDLLLKHYNNISFEVNSQTKDKNKKIARLTTLSNSLDKFNRTSLIKLDKDTDKLLVDEEITYQYLTKVLKHNFKLQNLEEVKNQEYNNNSITKLDIIFSKYGFNFNDFSDEVQSKILMMEPEKTEEIIKNIKYSELIFISEYIDLFASVILNSNLNIIKYMDMCLKNKYVTKEFILQNNRLLYDLEEYNNFFYNVNYITNLDIEMTNKEILPVLLLDNKELTNHLNMLKEYKISFQGTNFSNYDLLKNDQLLDYFDNFIELGYGQMIIDKPKYLNSSNDEMIKRIMICNLIGISPVNNYNKFMGCVTTGNNFYVGPNDYDKYIIDYKEDYQNPVCLEVLDKTPRNTINISTKHMPVVKALDDNFMKDELCYVIDDVIISRKRVLRNLEVLIKNTETMNISFNDLLFQAILYNMINNVESKKLEQIYNTISKIVIDKSKTYTFK